MLAKKLLAVLGIASLVFLVGCGGTTGQSINQPPAGVTVSPASATVQTGGVQQFTATVSLTANGAGSTSGGYCLNVFFGFNGTHSVAANGRATQTIENGIGSSPIIFYLISPSGLVAIEVTPGLSSGITIIEK